MQLVDAAVLLSCRFLCVLCHEKEVGCGLGEASDWKSWCVCQLVQIWPDRETGIPKRTLDVATTMIGTAEISRATSTEWCP